MVVSDTRPAFSNPELFLGMMMAPLGTLATANLIGLTMHTLAEGRILQSSQKKQLTKIRQALRAMNIPHKLANRVIQYQMYVMSELDHNALKTLYQNLSDPLELELRLVR